MKRKIEIHQQASWIFRVKPRKILKAIGKEWQVDTDSLQLRRFHEKRKVAASVQDKDKGKSKTEADMAAACFFPAEPCNQQKNGDAYPLHMKPELVASSSSNGCGVPSSVLSSLDMSLNPHNAVPRPARKRSRTRSLAAFSNSFCPKGRGEGSHSCCTKNEDTSRYAQRCPGLQKKLLLAGGGDCHEDQCSSCTVLSCCFCCSRFRRLSACDSADCNCNVAPPSDSGEESSQCDNFCMGHGTVAFSDKTDATTSDAKDIEIKNPNLEQIIESPEDIADRGALDLLLFAIQETAEADAAGVEEASNAPLPKSCLIFGSFPIRRKRIVRRARSVFRNCSHSAEEATRTPLPLQERSREQGSLQQLTEYNSERFPAKLRSINEKDDNATPVLRSKCGRARALPIKFCDSVLQPWY